MSYSFTIRADNKDDAKAKVTGELARVAGAQAMHIRDVQQAQAATDLFIDLLADDDSKLVYVSVNGSLGWQFPCDPGGEAEHPLTTASVGVTVSLLQRDTRTEGVSHA